VSVDRANAAEVDPQSVADAAAAADPGRVRLVSEAEADLVLPVVFDRYWTRVPGEVRRPAVWWDMLALDVEHDRDGASATRSTAGA
jgi:hypothetical protein